MSDGAPTQQNWEDSLNTLKQNNWYKMASKFAIAIGEKANVEVLAKFTGNSEAVYTTYNPTELKKLIKIITITSSEMGSKSTTIRTNNASPEEINEEAQKAMVNMVNKAIESSISENEFAPEYI